MSELAAVVRQQGRQAVSALTAGEAVEAGAFLLDALVRLADALERIELELQERR